MLNAFDTLKKFKFYELKQKCCIPIYYSWGIKWSFCYAFNINDIPGYHWLLIINIFVFNGSLFKFAQILINLDLAEMQPRSSFGLDYFIFRINVQHWKYTLMFILTNNSYLCIFHLDEKPPKINGKF